MTSKIINVLNGQKTDVPPIWFMRQAGRHLPEYLEIRATAKDFIDFCFSPNKAAEVTLQPIKRYDMDAAILFADILLIPIGLGRKVEFIKGTGPVLEPIQVNDIRDLTIDGAHDRISSVYETVSKVRSSLDKDKALIGFCGGAWTVATSDALKIFESWAEGLAPDMFERLVINPTRDIITRVREAGVDVPIMGFPRGAGLNAIRYAHCANQ